MFFIERKREREKEGEITCVIVLSFYPYSVYFFFFVFSKRQTDRQTDERERGNLFICFPHNTHDKWVQRGH